MSASDLQKVPTTWEFLNTIPKTSLYAESNFTSQIDTRQGHRAVSPAAVAAVLKRPVLPAPKRQDASKPGKTHSFLPNGSGLFTPCKKCVCFFFTVSVCVCVCLHEKLLPQQRNHAISIQTRPFWLDVFVRLVPGVHGVPAAERLMHPPTREVERLARQGTKRPAKSKTKREGEKKEHPEAWNSSRFLEPSSAVPFQEPSKPHCTYRSNRCSFLPLCTIHRDHGCFRLRRTDCVERC